MLFASIQGIVQMDAKVDLDLGKVVVQIINTSSKTLSSRSSYAKTQTKLKPLKPRQKETNWNGLMILDLLKFTGLQFKVVDIFVSFPKSP
jgi:hypothetical protein